MPRRLRRLALIVLLVPGLLLAALLAGAWAMAAASLPRREGVVSLAGLGAPVDVSRDALGVPVISAASFEDAAAAIGFLHAQDRFFQMDLLRRSAAGELSELLGAAALDADRAKRPLGLRAVARSVVADLPARHLAWLERYSAGVNAGLADLGARPPEYLLLRARPEPWTPQDSVLCMLAMYDSLALGARFERSGSIMRGTLPNEVADFLRPETARFDAPLIGPPGDPVGPMAVPDRTGGRAQAGPVMFHMEHSAPGSNGWAASGSKSADGRAILANDMHLALSVPGTWYRLQVEWGGAGVGGMVGVGGRRAAGVSLPGVPMVVVGSNGFVAWGFTNTTADSQDLVIVEPDPSDPARYLTPDGPEPFGTREEIIRVRGRQPERVAVRTTRWGPVVEVDPFGRTLALAWPMLDPARVNMGLLDMLDARTVDDAVSVVRAWRGEPQNTMLSDSTGRVAWVVSGWLPERGTSDGRYPASWAGAGAGWRGQLGEAWRPVLIDPSDGVVVTANQRTVPLDQSRRFGRHWSSGERAARIMAVLGERGGFTERDMLALQLDTRTEVFEAYRAAALSGVGEDGADPRVASAAAVIRGWSGRADADQEGFSALVSFRAALRRMLIEPVLAPCREKDMAFRWYWFQSDEALLRLLEARPASWLPEGVESWDDLVRAALRESVDERGAAPEWGTRSRASIRHPLSPALGWFGQWLDMPGDPLSGHGSAVRVQSASFGASERLVVSPGREEDGLFHMPAGQSGHWLSPHYRAGHRAWVRGEATPLLAGEAVSRFRLVPGDSGAEKE